MRLRLPSKQSLIAQREPASLRGESRGVKREIKILFCSKLARLTSWRMSSNPPEHGPFTNCSVTSQLNTPVCAPQYSAVLTTLTVPVVILGSSSVFHPGAWAPRRQSLSCSNFIPDTWNVHWSIVGAQQMFGFWMKKICIVLPNYPWKMRKTDLTFTQNM